MSWEFPRLCRGGSRSLTFPAVLLPVEWSCPKMNTSLHFSVQTGEDGKKPCVTRQQGNACSPCDSDEGMLGRVSGLPSRFERLPS